MATRVKQTMGTPDKVAAVAEFKERLADSEVAIITKFTGINVAQDTELRRAMREAGISYKVYKNTLARLALRELELESAAAYMDGACAWAFSKDPVAPAKLLKEYGSKIEFVKMQGGIVSGRVVAPEQLDALADMPSIDELRAKVVGALAAPLQNLVGVLNGLPRNLVSVLDQVRQQKEEGGAGEAA